MTEDIFDMSNVRNFKEIEKKNMGDVSTLLCLWSAELSIAFGLRNPFYSKISVVMLIGYRIAENSSQNKNMLCTQMLHILKIYMIHAWCKILKQW